MTELGILMKKYEEMFGELPDLPKMASYSQIEDELKEAIIRKKPLTQDEVMSALEYQEYDII